MKFGYGIRRGFERYLDLSGETPVYARNEKVTETAPYYYAMIELHEF